MATSPSTHNISRSPSPENDVFSISTALIPEQPQKPAGTTTITFSSLLSPPLLLHEDLTEGCGGQLWPAGMLLSTYLLTHHTTSFRNKSILELGAGGGLVGLAVALGCHPIHPVVITDQKPMLSLMQKNIAYNNLSSRVIPAIYNWGTSPPPPLPLPITNHYPDILLAADCVYFEPAFPLLLQTLSDLIGPDTICYFCFKKRRKADMRFVRDLVKKFEVLEVEWEGKEAGKRDGIFLYEVTCRVKTRLVR